MIAAELTRFLRDRERATATRRHGALASSKGLVSDTLAALVSSCCETAEVSVMRAIVTKCKT